MAEVYLPPFGAIQQTPAPVARNQAVAYAMARGADYLMMIDDDTIPTLPNPENPVGFFEAVTVISHPNGDRDQVWVAVRRTINGTTKRYIEYFDDAGSFYPTLNVDAAYVCDSSQAFKTFCGLSHLECSTVQIVSLWPHP